MSRIRFRQKRLLFASLIGGAAVLLICVIVGYLYFNYIHNKYEKRTAEIQMKLNEAEKRLNEERVDVTVVNKDHAAGDRLREEDLQTISVPKNSVPANTLDRQSVAGKFIKINIQANAVITEPMVFEEGITPDDLRIQEFRVIELPLKLKKDEFVDVRIKFPTGQDYIVLSKKKVNDLLTGTVWYNMSEKEILTMSSAIVDAYINNASIYALNYVDPYMQQQAIVTYPPNPKVQDLIDLDPNIIEVAKSEMERKVRDKLEQDLKSMPEEDVQKYVNGKSKDDSKAFEYHANPDQPEGSVQQNPLIDDGNSQNGGQAPDQAINQSNSTQIFNDNNVSVPIKK